MMMKMKAIAGVILAVIVMMTVNVTAFGQSEDENLIQMAILLDTSGSMDGLIDQAKSQLWKIVNELALSKKNGKAPVLEVALYEYGKDSIPATEGYLRMLVPLTTDLDRVSEELFALTTNGGSEYCGQVIQSSVRDLKWSKNNKVLKVIFIAGNEEFTQGMTDYKKSVKESISKGIIVNTIFCGDFTEGVNTMWKDGADRGDGKYINIDHNQKAVDIKAPQDARIIELNNELNSTYIAYGYKGEEKLKMQSEQDANASGMSNETIIQRSITKSSKLYSNSSWDLVDAMEEEEVEVSELKDEQLPEEMRGMTDSEKEAFVKKMLEKRKRIQEEIKKLNEERKKYVEKEMKKLSEDESLDSAIIGVIKEQAKEKEFKF